MERLVPKKRTPDRCGGRTSGAEDRAIRMKNWKRKISRPRRGKRFFSSPQPFTLSLGPTQAPILRVPGFFPVGKAAGM